MEPDGENTESHIHRKRVRVKKKKTRRKDSVTEDDIYVEITRPDDLSPPPPPPLPVDTRSRGGLSFDSRLSLDERRARDQQHASRPLTEAVSFVPAWARPSQISTTPIASPPRDKKENKELKKQHIKQVIELLNSSTIGGEPTEPDDPTVYARIRKSPLNKSNNAEYKGLYFNDGIRRIDFILAYEEKTELRADYAEERKKALSRKKYLMGLLRAGVEMERAVQMIQGAVINYIKLHLPFTMLCAYAEDLHFSVPLQEYDINGKDGHGLRHWMNKIYKCFRLSNPHEQDVPFTPGKYYTCKFKTDKLSNFYGGTLASRESTFFTATQRSVAVSQILRTTSFGKRAKGEVGIEPLLEDSIFTAAYPLHDCEKDVIEDDEGNDLRAAAYSKHPSDKRMRQILYEYWANYRKWYKYQPLEHVREYYGEKIGIYFVWLGFYTTFLMPAAVIGVLVFLYGLFTMNEDRVAQEVCSSGETLKMCPPCDNCQLYFLSELCWFVKLGYLFDHPGTVFYAVFMSFWAVFFLQFWQRKAARRAFDWDCYGFNETDERPRPEYMNLAPERAMNPITGMLEPYFPQASRNRRIFCSVIFIIFMMVIVLIFILGCILYRVLFAIYLHQTALGEKLMRTFSDGLAIISGTVINLILIIVMGSIYEILALKLTHWEMHRTQTEFENSYTVKSFLFQFVNFYSSIFYVGFFKGKFVGHPGNYLRVLGLRNEECTSGGCMIELAQQLLIIMVGKQIINNITEIILPKLYTWWQTRSLKTAAGAELVKVDHKLLQRWEADYLLLPYNGLFEEYLEMTLQFGFITIFVAACPLAPLFALINNWVELRLDAKKFIADFRRPVVERAQGIGVWNDILIAIAHIAVISNAFLIAFTSNFIPKLLYFHTVDSDLRGFLNSTLSVSHNFSEPCLYQDHRDETGAYTQTYWHLLAVRLMFVVVFEHFVFFVIKLIDFMVPDIPVDLDITIKREQYLAKQALADTQTSDLLAKEEDADEENDV